MAVVEGSGWEDGESGEMGVGSVSEEEQLRRLFLEGEGGGERKGVEHNLLLPISTPPPHTVALTLHPVNTLTPHPLNTLTFHPLHTLTLHPLHTLTPHPLNTLTLHPLNTLTPHPLNTLTFHPLYTLTFHPLHTLTPHPLNTLTLHPLTTLTLHSLNTLTLHPLTTLTLHSLNTLTLHPLNTLTLHLTSTSPFQPCLTMGRPLTTTRADRRFSASEKQSRCPCEKKTNIDFLNPSRKPHLSGTKNIPRVIINVPAVWTPSPSFPGFNNELGFRSISAMPMFVVIFNDLLH